MIFRGVYGFEIRASEKIKEYDAKKQLDRISRWKKPMSNLPFVIYLHLVWLEANL